MQNTSSVPVHRHSASCMGDGPDGCYHLCRLDPHKATISVALAESGRDGEFRQVGIFENRAEIVMKLAARLSKGGKR
jgi:hypothetical protein